MIAYRITCSANGKVYVGITTFTADERLKQHLAMSRQASRAWDRRPLYNAMRKYGPDCWSTEVVGSADTWEDLCALEVQLIAEHRSNDRQHGYNATLGGDGVLGMRHSPEVRERQSERVRGKKRDEAFCAAVRKAMQDPAVKAKCAAPHIGRKQSPEEIEKRVAKTRGRKVPQHVKDAVSRAMKGKPKSPEAIAKFIASRTGKRKTNEQIEKSAVFHRGRKRSDESKQRMSAAQQAYHARCQLGEAIRSPSWRINTRRDAAIAEAYYYERSYERAGAKFGIKGPAAWHATQRAIGRLIENLETISPLYEGIEITAPVHPDWLDLAGL